jgi:hypothetical protein
MKYIIFALLMSVSSVSFAKGGGTIEVEGKAAAADLDSGNCHCYEANNVPAGQGNPKEKPDRAASMAADATKGMQGTSGNTSVTN